MTLTGLKSLDVRCKVLDRINLEDFERELKDIPPEAIRYLWTTTEINLLEHYIPSMYHRIAKEFGIRNGRETRERRAKLAFQVQSELVNKSSTLDAGIVHGRRDRGSVSSKVYNLGRLCRMLEVLGMGSHEGIPEEVLATEDLDEILIHAKLRYAGFLKSLPEWAHPVETVRRVEQLTQDQRNKVSYIEEILQDVDGDIVAIALYGSAAKETNPRNYSDYDNFLVVRDGSMSRIYPKIKGRRFVHKDGKHIGLNLVEESVFTKFIRLNHDPNEHLEHCQVLYGVLDFPIVSEREIRERGTSYAVIRTKALKSACAWITKNPRLLLDKKDLFDYFQKTLLFIIQSALNSTEGVHYRSKEYLKKRLSEEGAEVLPFRKDTQYIIQATYRASVWATQLLEKYYQGKQFENGFMKF